MAVENIMSSQLCNVTRQISATNQQNWAELSHMTLTDIIQKNNFSYIQFSSTT